MCLFKLDAYVNGRRRESNSGDRRWITHLHRPGHPESKHQIEGMREEGKVPLHLASESEKLIMARGL